MGSKEYLSNIKAYNIKERINIDESCYYRVKRVYNIKEKINIDESCYHRVNRV